MHVVNYSRTHDLNVNYASHAKGENNIVYTHLIRWGAIIIELVGLVLISVELYFPKLSESLKATFEETKTKLMKNPKAWLEGYILIWIAAVSGLSVWDPSMILISNVFFSVITTIVLLILGVSKLLMTSIAQGNSINIDKNKINIGIFHFLFVIYN